MGHALVLNASFEPLQIVSWQKAMQLLFQGKVEVIEESTQEVRTVSLTLKVPSVLRLLQYIPTKRKRQMVRFSRSNVFLRDQSHCQYCGNQFPKSHLTLDHVKPVVMGGRKTWDNIVTACKSCNQRKGGRTPQQAGMSLIRSPRAPDWLPLATLTFGIQVAPERWQFYLSFHARTQN
jgi:5-methylcytosine-specific restriction endonuclease McrA